MTSAHRGAVVISHPGGRHLTAATAAARHRPAADPPARGRVKPVDLPPVELAVTVHSGPHDDIDVTYGRLGTWVVEHALAVDGPVHETYLVGPRDTADPATWRTEIGWPIFRLTPG